MSSSLSHHAAEERDSRFHTRISIGGSPMSKTRREFFRDLLAVGAVPGFLASRPRRGS